MIVISVDVGTSYIKGAAIKLDEATKRPVFLSTTGTRHLVISDGPVHEHSPRHIIAEIEKIVKHLAKEAGKVDALVFSTYLFSTVLLSKDGHYITNVITWLDRRSETALDEVSRHAIELYRRTGCPPLYIYSLPKLFYIRRVHPSALKESFVLDAKAMIFNHFTGELVTDLSTASGTHQMLNTWSLKWDDLALSLVGIDESQLPRLQEGDYVARIKPGIAREMGLPDDTPIVLGLYDGGSTIAGLSGFSPEVAVINMGTSSMLRVTSQNPVLDPTEDMGIQCYYLYRRTWIPGLGLNNCGIVLEHSSKAFKLSVEELIQAVRSITLEEYARSETPVVLPLLYPERHPRLSKSTGLWLMGLREGTTLPLIACSIVEGIVLMIRLVSDILAGSGASYSYAVAGGKVSSIPIVAPLLASALEKPVKISEIPDAIHIGNAAIAGLALKSLSEQDVRDIAFSFTKATAEPSPLLAGKISKNYEVFRKALAFAISL